MFCTNTCKFEKVLSPTSHVRKIVGSRNYAVDAEPKGNGQPSLGHAEGLKLKWKNIAFCWPPSYPDTTWPKSASNLGVQGLYIAVGAAWKGPWGSIHPWHGIVAPFIHESCLIDIVKAPIQDAWACWITTSIHKYSHIIGPKGSVRARVTSATCNSAIRNRKAHFGASNGVCIDIAEIASQPNQVATYIIYGLCNVAGQTCTGAETKTVDRADGIGGTCQTPSAIVVGISRTHARCWRISSADSRTSSTFAISSDRARFALIAEARAGIGGTGYLHCLIGAIVSCTACPAAYHWILVVVWIAHALGYFCGQVPCAAIRRAAELLVVLAVKARLTNGAIIEVGREYE
jgi:hypothetical protein